MLNILDRINGCLISEAKLPNEITLGRFAVVKNGDYCELTQSSFKVKKGQRIDQEFLEPKHKDKHEILEKIAANVDAGNFLAIPLIQGIKQGLDLNEFELALEDKLNHIEAIFHNPHSKLNRTAEKVPVSKAKRISTRSYDYLAAHTEDWLHKGLISFHPSRIITEELIVDEDVYENRLLIAFIIRATQYLERRISHTKDISQFLKDYAKLIAQNSANQGWYKRINREMDLAGRVYDEDSGNYKAVASDANVATLTQNRLKRLRDKLLRFRQYDLFFNVSVKDVNSFIYRDTNVMINHQHYRYLKELWMLLNTEENSDAEKDKREAEVEVVENLRKYSISIVNYAILNNLKYTQSGTDTSWQGTKENIASIIVKYNEDGVINVSIGDTDVRFVALASSPTTEELTIPTDTYLLVYANGITQSKNTSVIPIALNDISTIERVAIVIRQYIFRNYLMNTVFKEYSFPRQLQPFVPLIENHCRYIKVNISNDTYRFNYYPKDDTKWSECQKEIKASDNYKSRNKQNQLELDKCFSNFIEIYDFSVLHLQDNLRCFNLNCDCEFEQWACDDLHYIECVNCGSIIDCSQDGMASFCADTRYSIEELGMDYIEVEIGK